MTLEKKKLDFFYLSEPRQIKLVPLVWFNQSSNRSRTSSPVRLSPTRDDDGKPLWWEWARSRQWDDEKRGPDSRKLTLPSLALTVPGVMATPLPLTTGLSSSSSSGGSMLARCSMLLTDWFLFLLPWALGRAPGSRASLTFRGGAAGDGSAGGLGVP